jgi:hypothetical protein
MKGDREVKIIGEEADIYRTDWKVKLGYVVLG